MAGLFICFGACLIVSLILSSSISVIVAEVFNNIIVLKDMAEGNKLEYRDLNYCTREAEGGVPVINVAKLF